MNSQLNEILKTLGRQYEGHLLKGSRHYMEVSIADQAEKLGYADLKERFAAAYAIIPLKSPQRGMKVRIDGRTFVDYAQYETGVVLPGRMAREIGGTYTPYVPWDSMICNFV